MATNLEWQSTSPNFKEAYLMVINLTAIDQKQEDININYVLVAISSWQAYLNVEATNLKWLPYAKTRRYEHQVCLFCHFELASPSVQVV